jgi:hypothetical protein
MHRQVSMDVLQATRQRPSTWSVRDSLTFPCINPGILLEREPEPFVEVIFLAASYPFWPGRFYISVRYVCLFHLRLNDWRALGGGMERTTGTCVGLISATVIFSIWIVIEVTIPSIPKHPAATVHQIRHAVVISVGVHIAHFQDVRVLRSKDSETLPPRCLNPAPRTPFPTERAHLIAALTPGILRTTRMHAGS